jgi:peptidoglycan/xylan/chitin deacetylase (PgdA/CDA1 family)
LTASSKDSDLKRRLDLARVHLRLGPGLPDLFGSEKSFHPPIGKHWAPDGPVRGYYIDFRVKVGDPTWPPPWFDTRERQYHVSTAQWGLGAYEHYLCGAGDEYLTGARGAADVLVEIQDRDDPGAGGWTHLMDMPHTFPLRSPWLSGMAQGEGASLLVRMYLETGDERYAEAARLALLPMRTPVAEGGVLATMDGQEILEEYPTAVPSAVLNGTIFALWGFHDVGRGLGDAQAAEDFERLTTSLATLIERYDTGYWSRYDLYPHAMVNLATPSYHLLHIRQLTALDQLSHRPELTRVVERFVAYRENRSNKARAITAKVAFRLRTPRNRLLARRGVQAGGEGGASGSDVLVLCYHAVSPTWPADLSIAPELLRKHLRHLVSRGYAGVTFSDAVAAAREGRAGKFVAVTFDDGYRSVLDLALPILTEVGMDGTLFVPTDHIGSAKPMTWPGIEQWLGTEHERELLPLSWAEVAALHDAGWEIGSHTCSHPRLSRISAAELHRELTASKARCEGELGECESIAYPYGDYNPAVVDAAAKAGYSSAATLPEGMPPAAALAWPRVGIYNNDDMRTFRIKVSPAIRRLRGTGAWPRAASALRAVKRKAAG